MMMMIEMKGLAWAAAKIERQVCLCFSILTEPVFDVGKYELHGSNDVTFGNVRQAEQRRQVGRVETKKNNNNEKKENRRKK